MGKGVFENGSYLELFKDSKVAGFGLVDGDKVHTLTADGQGVIFDEELFFKKDYHYESLDHTDQIRESIGRWIYDLTDEVKKIRTKEISLTDLNVRELYKIHLLDLFNYFNLNMNIPTEDLFQTIPPFRTANFGLVSTTEGKKADYVFRLKNPIKTMSLAREKIFAYHNFINHEVRSIFPILPGDHDNDLFMRMKRDSFFPIDNGMRVYTQNPATYILREGER